MDTLEKTDTIMTNRTAVLVTNQFKCERLIQAGRVVADITHTELIVLNVQSHDYPPNPLAIQYLYDVSKQQKAVMNVLYSDNTYKTIVKYIKHNKISNVITGTPSTENSVLHQIWKKFTHIQFFAVDGDGKLSKVSDKSAYTQKHGDPASNV